MKKYCSVNAIIVFLKTVLAESGFLPMSNSEVTFTSGAFLLFLPAVMHFVAAHSGVVAIAAVMAVACSAQVAMKNMLHKKKFWSSDKEKVQEQALNEQQTPIIANSGGKEEKEGEEGEN